MRWTCPKCGKKLDISNEQLIAYDGVIVCPQCLLQAHQPIPKVRIPSSEEGKTGAPSRRKQQRDITFDSDTPPEYKPAPPPHKTRMKQQSAPRSDNAASSGTPPPAQRKEPARKRTQKRKKKKRSEGMSAWGCVWRTVVFTMVLFAAYVFFGLLLEAIQ